MCASRAGDSGYLLAAGLVVMLMLLAGCGSKRSKQVAHNLALLHSLPMVPSTRETSATSHPYLESSGPELLRRTAGYTTTATIQTPKGVTGLAVVSFYRRHLVGWHCRVTESAPLEDSFILECGRGRSKINVNTDNLSSPKRFYEIIVDADGASG